MKISVRPSGTEPKIKFYFSMKGKIEGSLESSMTALDHKLNEAANLLAK
jgi:phosphoglucomutase